MERVQNAVNASISAMAGIGYIELGGSYWALAIAGCLIGLVRWFHKVSHSEECDIKSKKSISEAMLSMLFGLLAMPAAIDIADPYLLKYNITAPSVKILIGAIVAFYAVELIPLAFSKIKKGLKNVQ